MIGLVTAAGVTLQWAVEDQILVAEATAQTSGWVAVGLNTEAHLSGSVLVLGAVGGAVEEHIAQPPRHPPRASLGGQPAVIDATVTSVDGLTTLRFRLDLSADDGVGPLLDISAPTGVTLAWSRSPDLDHHSAQRDLVVVTLGAPRSQTIAPGP